MSSLFRDYVAAQRSRADPFRSQSMGLCLVAPPARPLRDDNNLLRGLKVNLPAPMPAISKARPSVTSWLLDCGLLNQTECRPPSCNSKLWVLSAGVRNGEALYT